MSPRHDITFEAFVEICNRNAPSDMLTHGLGILPESIMGIRARAERAIDDALETVDFGAEDGERVDLRLLLAQKIAPFLRDERHGDEAKSMLDIVTLGLTDDAAIKNFIRRHGVDLDQQEDLAYLNRVFEEATDFLENDIYQARQKVNPGLRKTKTVQGIYAIFKTAAGKDRKILISQACALLRIAYVINYIERDPILSLLPDAGAALETLMAKHIHKDTATRERFFATGIPGDSAISLSNFELRLKKRQRIIAKLLHKPSNRANEVLDHIGFRITTHNSVDTLRLIYKMFFHPDHPVFPSTYIIIGHGKNLLFDEKQVLELFGDPNRARDFVMSLAEPTLDHAELTTVDGTAGITASSDNPHSSGTYQAIHIVFDIPIRTHRGERRLFPIEIQFLDNKTSRVNEETAPHSDYVRRQMAAVIERVTRNNLDTAWRERSGKQK